MHGRGNCISWEQRGAESWLNAVSFIIVTTSPRKELNDREGMLKALTRSLVKRNTEAKEGGINE